MIKDINFPLLTKIKLYLVSTSKVKYLLFWRKKSQEEVNSIKLMEMGKERVIEQFDLKAMITSCKKMEY